MTDPVLELLQDPEWLAGLVGRPVRAVRVRPKPGVGHTCALLGPDGDPAGWLRVLLGEQRGKADKVRRRLAEAGRLDRLGERELPEHDALVLWGPVATDPALVRQVARLGLDGELDVLRHNPGRRLVLRHGDSVLRITDESHRDALAGTAGRLAALGVPVVAPLAEQGGDRRVSRWPWVAGHDLGRSHDDEQLRQAGRALAALHAAPVREFGALPRCGWTTARTAAERATQQLVEVAPSAGVPAQDVLLTLPRGVASGPRSVLHGDFSLDQCLAGPDGVQLTDLARACTGPVQLDLATLLADALLSGDEVAPLLQAWQQQRGPGADLALLDLAGSEVPGALAPWVAAALLARVSEPWRAQQSGWEAECLRRIGLAQQLLWNPQAPGHAWRVPRVVEGVTGDRVHVSRAWPEVHDRRGRVSLEGTDDQGRLRAGHCDLGGIVNLLPPGRDKRLPGLQRFATQGRLVVHRAGRRAVVETGDGYVKVLRPGRAAAAAHKAGQAHLIAQRIGVAAPQVTSVADDHFVMSRVPGIAVSRLSGHSDWARVWQEWADAWQRLQDLAGDPLVADLPRYEGGHEQATLERWLERSRASGVLQDGPWLYRLAGLAEDFAALPGGRRLVPTHRDLHDKQLLWHDGRLGVLDFDTACLAPAEVDLVNLAVHARLRQAQGGWDREASQVVEQQARRLARLADVSDEQWRRSELAVVARLAAVYAHRPRWREQVLAWAEQEWQAG